MRRAISIPASAAEAAKSAKAAKAAKSGGTEPGGP
jgi:hypothetical protein